MSETISFTLLPKSGSLRSGQIENIDQIGYDSKYIASFKKQEMVLTDAFNAAVMSKEDQAYVANALKQNKKAIYKVANVDQKIMTAQKSKLKLEHLQELSAGQGRFDRNINRAMEAEYRKYQAAVNGLNTNQLTIVQFVNEIVGKLEQPSYVTAAFKSIQLDKLRGKIPEMGWPSVSIQVKRLQEPEIYNTRYGQNEFRIYRNDVHIYTSREDRMEAVIDPHAVSLSQGNQQMLRARELLGLKELSNLVVNGTYGTIPDITATPSGSSAPASTNDAPKAFVKAMVGHFNTWKNYLKYFIWNPIDYRSYLSNWFSHAYEGIQIPEGFGVIPFYGLEKYGGVAIISPYAPQGTVYAVANEGAYELDGPYIVDQEYDAKKFADYSIVHDFIGYKVMHPERFGDKFTLANQATTPEITTNEQIFNLLAPPSDVVETNADA